MRPLFSPEADLPALRARLEQWDRMGRYMERGFTREDSQIDSIRCQWVHVPQADPERIVLYLHGGGFCTRTPYAHGQLLSQICQRVGATGLMPDYRLAPEHPFPAAFDDIMTVYRWVMDQGFDPGKIVFGGDSAGGTLVLATLLQARDSSLPLPACAVMFSPWSGRSSLSLPGDSDQDALLSRAAVDAFYHAWKPDRDPDHPLDDLTGCDFTGLPPLLIQAGGEEILLSDAEEWVEKARLAGVEATLQVFSGMAHAFQVAGFLPEAKEAIDLVGAFIGQFFE